MDLREELTFDNKTKLVLLLSFSTNKMIKQTMMYPEVYFMDCTGKANCQKRELFISVVRSPSFPPSFSSSLIHSTGKPVSLILNFTSTKDGSLIYFI